MKLLAFISFIIILASCNPVSKAIKTLDKNPEAAAIFCATRFPAKDSIIKGDTIIKTDTVENILVDTVQILCPPNGTETIKIKAACPPSKTIYINTHTSDTIIRRDRAAETVLSNALTASQTLVTKLQGQYEDMKDKRDKWRLYFFILLGSVGVYVLLKLKRILP